MIASLRAEYEDIPQIEILICRLKNKNKQESHMLWVPDFLYHYFSLSMCFKSYGSQWSYRLSLWVEKYFGPLNYTFNITNLTCIHFGEMCSSVSCGFPSNVGKCGLELASELPKFSPRKQF